MPPQQRERFLDAIDSSLRFGAHDENLRMSGGADSMSAARA
jgi:hypothetical protein